MAPERAILVALKIPGSHSSARGSAGERQDRTLQLDLQHASFSLTLFLFCSIWLLQCFMLVKRVLAPESRVSLIRTISLALLAVSLMSTMSRAGDYVVSWAFDAGDKNETGIRADCVYSEFCTIKPEKSDFDIRLIFRRPGYRVVSILISQGLDCCYFAQGERSVERGTESLIRIGIYEGRARKGNEYVLNTPLGFFYLQFSDLK